MSRDDPHFRLRLPADLRALVERAAEENRRSLTAEILARLDKSFSLPDPTTGFKLPPPEAGLRARYEAVMAAMEAMGKEDDRRFEIRKRLGEEIVGIMKEAVDTGQLKDLR